MIHVIDQLLILPGVTLPTPVVDQPECKVPIAASPEMSGPPAQPAATVLLQKSFQTPGMGSWLGMEWSLKTSFSRIAPFAT